MENPSIKKLYKICIFLFSRIRENVARLSLIMRDRDRHPMEEAVWLLEHVGRTGGAEHLKLGSRKLNLLQYYCLDCVAFLFVMFYVVFNVAKFLSKKRRKDEQASERKKGKKHD